MKNFFFKTIFIFLCFAARDSFAQSWQTDKELRDVKHVFELNGTLGANNFLGDVGGNPGIGGTVKDYTFKTIRPLIGASINYNMSYSVALKAGFNYTAVAGADSLIKNEGGEERWRYNRNLSFKSSIIEGYAGLDIYPTILFSKKYAIRPLVPVVGIGIGVFHFNPRAQLDGKWIELQPLSLEGEGFDEYPDRSPYKLTQLYIPINVGLKYYVNNKIAVSGGLQFRHTFTDYIDDISTTYIDSNLFAKYLPPEQAAEARQLYARPKTDKWRAKIKPGNEKAHSDDEDTYVTFYVSVSIRLNTPVQFFYGR